MTPPNSDRILGTEVSQGETGDHEQFLMPKTAALLPHVMRSPHAVA